MAVTFKIPIDSEHKDTGRFQSNVYFYSKNNKLSNNIGVVLDIDKYRKKALDLMKENPGLSYDVAFNCSKFGLKLPAKEETSTPTSLESSKNDIGIKQEEIVIPKEEIKEITEKEEQSIPEENNVFSDDYFNDFSYFSDFSNLSKQSEAKPIKEMVQTNQPSLDSLLSSFYETNDSNQSGVEEKKNIIVSKEDIEPSTNTFNNDIENPVEDIKADIPIKEDIKPSLELDHTVNEEIENPLINLLKQNVQVDEEIENPLINELEKDVNKKELNNPLIDLLHSKENDKITNPLLEVINSKEETPNNVVEINSFLDELNGETIESKKHDDLDGLFGFEQDKQKIKSLTA